MWKLFLRTQYRTYCIRPSQESAFDALKCCVCRNRPSTLQALTAIWPSLKLWGSHMRRKQQRQKAVSTLNSLSLEEDQPALIYGETGQIRGRCVCVCIHIRLLWHRSLCSHSACLCLLVLVERWCRRYAWRLWRDTADRAGRLHLLVLQPGFEPRVGAGLLRAGSRVQGNGECSTEYLLAGVPVNLSAKWLLLLLVK